MQVEVLTHIESIMLRAKRQSHGLWKLGDTLGDHIATPSTMATLQRVANAARRSPTRHSATHGLVLYAREHPESRRTIRRFLQSLARQAPSWELRTSFNLDAWSVCRQTVRPPYKVNINRYMR